MMASSNSAALDCVEFEWRGSTCLAQEAMRQMPALRVLQRIPPPDCKEPPFTRLQRIPPPDCLLVSFLAHLACKKDSVVALTRVWRGSNATVQKNKQLADSSLFEHMPYAALRNANLRLSLPRNEENNPRMPALRLIMINSSAEGGHMATIP